jgi:hypothetical protein
MPGVSQHLTNDLTWARGMQALQHVNLLAQFARLHRKATAQYPRHSLDSHGWTAAQGLRILQQCISLLGAGPTQRATMGTVL